MVLPEELIRLQIIATIFIAVCIDNKIMGNESDKEDAQDNEREEMKDETHELEDAKQDEDEDEEEEEEE